MLEALLLCSTVKEGVFPSQKIIRFKSADRVQTASVASDLVEGAYFKVKVSEGESYSGMVPITYSDVFDNKVYNVMVAIDDLNYLDSIF